MEFRGDVYLGPKHPISPPLMNGGGCCKTLPDVRNLAKMPIGAIILGSITWDEKPGNEGSVFGVTDGDGLNALGMPNRGRKTLTNDLSEMTAIAHGEGKALVANVAGSTPDEYGNLAELALENHADAVELNLSCPNVVTGNGSRKPIACYNVTSVGRILSAVERAVGKDSAVWIKVSPYCDMELLKEIAFMILSYRAPKALTTMNTFPGAYDFDRNGSPAISVGFAGLSGRAVKKIRIGQIMQWHAALEGKLKIIGVGGIDSGSDIHKSNLAGAVACQITTPVIKAGYINGKIFHSVIDEYLDIEKVSA